LTVAAIPHTVMSSASETSLREALPAKPVFGLVIE